MIIQSLSYVWLFETPWTAPHQASLSFTISWSLLKFVSIESVISSNQLILCCPLLLCHWSFPASGFFSMSLLFASGGQSVLKNIVWFHLYELSRLIKFLESESTLINDKLRAGMVWWGEGIGSWCLIGTEFQFRKVKNLGDGWWWELHNSVTEININIVKIVCFTVCDFYQHRKHSKNHLYLFLLFIYFIEVYLIYSVALVSGAQQYATDIIPLILALVQSSWIGQK